MRIDEWFQIIRMIMENAFKQALEQALEQTLKAKQVNQLPSNFSYKMMEEIRKEALKKKQRKAFVDSLILFGAVAIVLGLGIYVLFVYMGVSFSLDLLPDNDHLKNILSNKEALNGFLPDKGVFKDLLSNYSNFGDAFLFKFYSFIALIVLLLLWLDYKLHRRFFWK